MSYLGVGVSPGNVPVYHGSNLKAVDRRVRVAELVLRGVISGLAILSALLIGTDTQVKEIFSIQKKAKFTDMKALVGSCSTVGSVSQVGAAGAAMDEDLRHVREILQPSRGRHSQCTVCEPFRLSSSQLFRLTVSSVCMERTRARTSEDGNKN
ncbi:UNVERIFIED_CONTAM: CASP-like protein 2B1 [Sesamum radiatum]|uniref:CASP-like protein n=1 Tax=Sesamum radiatum TaxID=300843 RepID=A0AAW2LQX8_SESRA